MIRSGFIFILLAMTLPAPHAFAIPKAHIEMAPGIFSGGSKVVIRGEEVKTSFFHRGFAIAELMKDNPEAQKHAQTHISYAKWSAISLWIGLGAALSYAVSADSDDFNSGTYLGILGLGLIPSAILHHASTAYLHKAINSYNGVVPGYSANLSLTISPTKNGPTINLTHNF